MCILSYESEESIIVCVRKIKQSQEEGLMCGLFMFSIDAQEKRRIKVRHVVADNSFFHRKTDL